MLNKTTLWFSHPNQNHSTVNKLLLQELQNHWVDLKVHNLDLLYPDYQIDIVKEQQLLQKSDRIILMFPIYWVGMPAMLSLWREKVFLENFAYTPPYSNSESQLAHKELIIIMTLGAPETAYTKNGFIGSEWSQYIHWIQAMASFTGMHLKNTYPFFNAQVTHTQNHSQLHNRIKNFAKNILNDIKDGL